MRQLIFNSFQILIILLSIFKSNCIAITTRFHSRQRNQVLNKTADLERTAQDKKQCLSFCQYDEWCQALNAEKLSEFQYICYLFYYARILNLTRNDFITKANTQYNFIKFANCRDSDSDQEITNGAYLLRQNEYKFKAWCSVNDDGVWTVIMRHTDDGITFDKSWKEFKEGFGNLSATHWVGNEYIHALTKNNDMEAKVEIIDNNGTEYVGKYSQFMVASEQEKYQLTVGGFQSSDPNFLNGFTLYNGQNFFTYDQTNSCPQQYGNNGWWFTGCNNGFMTGAYLQAFPHGNTWGDMLVKYSVIKVRRK